MQEYLQPLLAAAVLLLMLVVGMDCTGEGFRRSMKRPGLIAAVTVFQYLLIPAVILAVVSLLGVHPALATALLLIGACPSGTISNAFTFLARGNSSLSVTLTAISNLVAFVAMPLTLAAVGQIAGGEISQSLQFSPAILLRQLLVSMVLPLAIGIAIRKRFPTWVLGNLKLIRALSVLLILSVVGLTVLANPPEITQQLKALIFPVLAITPLLFLLAWVVAKIFRADAGDKKAILFELPCRNVALAMLISMSVLQRFDLAYMAMAFFMLETSVILILAGYMNRTGRNDHG